MGIYGAAFSAAVMGAVGLAADFHYSEKHYKLPLEWRTLGVITAAAVATFLWLVNWDITTTALFGWVDGSLMPRLQAALADSVLADWREGRLVHELADHSKPVTEILLKGMFAAGFGTLLPIVHPPTRTKWLAAAQRRVSRRLSA